MDQGDAKSSRHCGGGGDAKSSRHCGGGGAGINFLGGEVVYTHTVGAE